VKIKGDQKTARQDAKSHIGCCADTTSGDGHQKQYPVGSGNSLKKALLNIHLVFVRFYGRVTIF
jgi:hypothetical protein